MLNPEYSIGTVAKSMPLLSQPLCRLFIMVSLERKKGHHLHVVSIDHFRIDFYAYQQT